MNSFYAIINSFYSCPVYLDSVECIWQLNCEVELLIMYIYLFFLFAEYESE